MTAEFWAGISSLSAPALATVVAVAFVWALATERLVLGRQYRAERARADKYDEDNRALTQTVIRNTASNEATVGVVTSFQRQLAELAGKPSP